MPSLNPEEFFQGEQPTVPVKKETKKKKTKNKNGKIDYLKRIYKLKKRLVLVNKMMSQILDMSNELSAKDEKLLLDLCTYKASVLKSLAWMKASVAQRQLEAGRVSAFMNASAKRKGYNNYDELVVAAKAQFKLYESYEQNPTLLYESELRSYRAKKTALPNSVKYDTTEINEELGRVLK